jgi:hypothetical protein
MLKVYLQQNKSLTISLECVHLRDAKNGGSSSSKVHLAITTSAAWHRRRGGGGEKEGTQGGYIAKDGKRGTLLQYTNEESGPTDLDNKFHQI